MRPKTTFVSCPSCHKSFALEADGNLPHHAYDGGGNIVPCFGRERLIANKKIAAGTHAMCQCGKFLKLKKDGKYPPHRDNDCEACGGIGKLAAR